MLHEEYFVREELKEKGLAWASDEEPKVKTNLNMDEFKALMRIELRKCVSCLNAACIFSMYCVLVWHATKIAHVLCNILPSRYLQRNMLKAEQHTDPPVDVLATLRVCRYSDLNQVAIIQLRYLKLSSC
jgi:hypothetical protein